MEHKIEVIVEDASKERLCNRLRIKEKFIKKKYRDAVSLYCTLYSRG
jgi:hypothetical protein